MPDRHDRHVIIQADAVYVTDRPPERLRRLVEDAVLDAMDRVMRGHGVQVEGTVRVAGIVKTYPPPEVHRP